ncbi:unnamed protein product [Camellia sinensis]
MTLLQGGYDIGFEDSQGSQTGSRPTNNLLLYTEGLDDCKLVNNRIAWRGDSGLEHGREVNLDLSKGMYDAGDIIKFGFPMAFTATVLSWSILEYGDHMKAVKELEHAQDSLKWITDYLINAHPSDNVLYIQ